MCNKRLLEEINIKNKAQSILIGTNGQENLSAEFVVGNSKEEYGIMERTARQ